MQLSQVTHILCRTNTTALSVETGLGMNLVDEQNSILKKELYILREVIILFSHSTLPNSADLIINLHQVIIDH